MTHVPSKPNPGSDAAIAQGCTCPVIDNHHGRGMPALDADGQERAWFVFREDCPLHGGKDWLGTMSSDAR